MCWATIIPYLIKPPVRFGRSHDQNYPRIIIIFKPWTICKFTRTLLWSEFSLRVRARGHAPVSSRLYCTENRIFNRTVDTFLGRLPSANTLYKYEAYTLRPARALFRNNRIASDRPVPLVPRDGSPLLFTMSLMDFAMSRELGCSRARHLFQTLPLLLIYNIYIYIKHCVYLANLGACEFAHFLYKLYTYCARILCTVMRVDWRTTFLRLYTILLYWLRQTRTVWKV